MTYQERFIVTAYTGSLMCDMQGFHKYAEEKLGVEIQFHQFGSKQIWDTLHEATKEVFKALCVIDN